MTDEVLLSREVLGYEAGLELFKEVVLTTGDVVADTFGLLMTCVWLAVLECELGPYGLS